MRDPSPSLHRPLRRGVPIDTLIENRDYLRHLARALVRDDSAADDVVQDTLMVALERAPRDVGATRGWLASVAQNIARQSLRSESRRTRRERTVARAELVGESTSLAEHGEVRERILDAVLALGEPVHTAIHLHYLQGLSVPEVAGRTGAPLETTRSRIRKGEELLRQRLDGEYGDRETWRRALVPLAGGVMRARTAGTGALALARLLVSVLVPLSLLTGALIWFGPWKATDATAASAPTGTSAPTTQARETASNTGESARAVIPEPASTGAAGPAASFAVAIHGTVEFAGRPAVGARVYAAPSEHASFTSLGRFRLDWFDLTGGGARTTGDGWWSTTTDADGAFLFELPKPSKSWLVAAVHPTGGVTGRALLRLRKNADQTARGRVHLTLAGGPTAAGEVLDEWGAPLANARVAAHMIQEAGSAARARAVYRTRTDEAGRYTLPALATEKLGLRVEKRGYATRWAAPLDLAGRQHWELDAIVLSQAWVGRGTLQASDGDLAAVAALAAELHVGVRRAGQASFRSPVGVGATGVLLFDTEEYELAGSAPVAVDSTIGIFHAKRPLALARVLEEGVLPHLEIDAALVDELTAEHEIALLIEDAATGAALSEFQLRFDRLRPEHELAWPWKQREDVRSEDGSVTIGDLEPGRYAVQIIADGYCRGVQLIEASVGRATPRVVALQPNPATLRLLFETPGGTPIRHGRVLLFPADLPEINLPRGNAVLRPTRRNGMYVFNALEPGPYRALVLPILDSEPEVTQAGVARVPATFEVLVEPGLNDLHRTVAGEPTCFVPPPGVEGPFALRLWDAESGMLVRDDRLTGELWTGSGSCYRLGTGRYGAELTTSLGRTLPLEIEVPVARELVFELPR